MEDEYKVACAPSNSVIFDDLEWPWTQVSMSQYSLKANISQTSPSVRAECCGSTDIRLRRSDHITDALISLHWLRVPERIVFEVAVQTYRALHGDAPRQFTPVANTNDDATMTSVFHIGWSVCSCCQTAYCYASCFLCRWRSCLERSSCRRHFSTFSVHFPKTFKTVSFTTLLSWPCSLN